MKENPLLDSSKRFAIDIVNLCNAIKAKSVLINQILRSGTSIGANIHEAQYAHSRNDFIAKLEIALKECYETEFWLELLMQTKFLDEETFKELLQKAGSIRRLLISSCITAKSKK